MFQGPLDGLRRRCQCRPQLVSSRLVLILIDIYVSRCIDLDSPKPNPRYQLRLVHCPFSVTPRWLIINHNHLPPRYLNILGVLMFITFMLLVAIVYLNLLVAIMTSGYTEVKKEVRSLLYSHLRVGVSAVGQKWRRFCCLVVAIMTSEHTKKRRNPDILYLKWVNPYPTLTPSNVSKK